MLALPPVVCYLLGMRPQGTPEQLYQRRLDAVRLVEHGGLSQARVARDLGVSRASICAWVKLYRDGGEQALRVKSPTGRPSELSDEQVEDIRRCVLEGPLLHGWTTDLWTLPRVAQLIKRRHKVSYHPDHLSRLMREWDQSWQKPLARPVERDQGRIDAWLGHDWRRIKKKPAG